jgi:hypothetical protein
VAAAELLAEVGVRRIKARGGVHADESAVLEQRPLGRDRQRAERGDGCCIRPRAMFISAVVVDARAQPAAAFGVGKGGDNCRRTVAPEHDSYSGSG